MLFFLKNKRLVNHTNSLLLKEIGIIALDNKLDLEKDAIYNDLPGSNESNKNINDAKINACSKDLRDIETPVIDFNLLKNNAISCKLCNLCNFRKNVVFGYGSTNIGSCLIIGEAPGEQEDISGLPFVGKSGKLLDEMLKAISIDRNMDVFITNVVKCRPPANRNPRPEEISSCRPILLDQIDFLKPRKILVLGRFAANVVLENDMSIRELRGKIHHFSNKNEKIPVVVSYHPAYLLRKPEEKKLAWEDLCLLTSF